MQFEIETDLPLCELRKAEVAVFHPPLPGNWRAASWVQVKPVNRPKVEVVNATKGRKSELRIRKRLGRMGGILDG